MPISHAEASTFNEYQTSLSQTLHRKFYCKLLGDNPELPVVDIGMVSWVAGNYVYSTSEPAGSATLSLASNVNQGTITSNSILNYVCSTNNVSGSTAFPLESTTSQEVVECVALFACSAEAAIQFCSLNHPAKMYSFDVVSNDPQLESNIIDFFDIYRDQEFDTDISYEFTNALDRLIRANGKSAIDAIHRFIEKGGISENVIFETLKALGRIEDEPTKNARYDLLMVFIKNEVPLIRDAAISALSFLDDERALPQLRMLLERETLPILKNNIKVAIKSLEYS